MSPIDVVLVDDSAICRSRLQSVIEAEGDARVVAALQDGRDVLRVLHEQRPQVLITDLVMPEVGGLDIVRTVMRSHPLPIIVVSGGGFASVSAFDVTRLGALEIAAKPDYGDHRAEAALRSAIRRVATVRVIRHPGTLAAGATPAGPAPTRTPVPGAPRRLPATFPTPRVLGIGASAGGPPAIAALLQALPVGTELSVLVAQHMPLNHARSFARFLEDRARLEVRICSAREPLRPGVIFVPDDGCDLVMIGPREAASVPARDGLAPSVDVLLESVARHVGATAAGVVLSGIGSDGAAGLRAMRDAGCLTLAQDEASCGVYGMPRAAAPFAVLQLPPPEIAREVAAARSHPERDASGPGRASPPSPQPPPRRNPP